ncbi:MAG: iron-containing redox enzyme family protein [Pseudomonadota bacterium]
MTAMIKHVTTSNDVMRALPSFPVSIANELRPLLEKADIETYKHFLSTMYHYTYRAEEQLTHARDLCSDPELFKYFDIMAKEERGHYLLAKKDFEEFGGNVETTERPASVKNFQDYWYALGTDNVNEFVGAMYVFENVASALAREIIDMMKRLELTKRQSRWLRVHLEADVGHGDEALQMCEKYVGDNPEAMLRAAEYGTEEWAAVFKYAFSHNG